MLKAAQWLISIGISILFIGRSWAHLDALHVPQVNWDIAFIFLGGVNFGLTIAAIVIYFLGRNDS